MNSDKPKAIISESIELTSDQALKAIISSLLIITEREGGPTARELAALLRKAASQIERQIAN